MSGPRAFGLEWAEAEIDLAGWQGVAALGFDPAPPPGVAAVLVVTLARPASGLAPQDLALVAPDGGALEGAVQPVADGDAALRVRFPEQGPRGGSRVRLLTGGDDPLHPFFAEGTFDFFIDCPAGDCRPSAEPGEAAASRAPAVDLATKDFDGFASVLENWTLATEPAWGDLAPASTERMLLELLAHHAEMLSLHQDRVAQEAFVDTARERISLARHAAFLGLALDDGRCARSVAAVDVGPGLSGYLPAASRIVRREAGGRVTATFVTEAATLLDARWNAGLAGAADRGALRPAAWPGARDAAIPAGATTLLLLDWELGLLPGRRIGFAQGADAHVATLTAVEETEAPGWTDDPAAAPGLAPRRVTRIAWAEPLPRRFAPWLDPVGLPFLVTGNLVDIRHGEPHRASNRAAEGVAGLGGGRADLVVATDPATGEPLIRALRTPEGDVLVEPDGRPALSVRIAGEDWRWQPDLWTSAGFDRHFATERDEDGSVWLTFGDGLRGRALPLPAGTTVAALGPAPVIELSFRRGSAAEGAVGAFALSAALPPDGADAAAAAEFAALAIRSAANLLPGTGARPPAPLDVARQLIPESIRHPARERCVAAEDYARAAEEEPGVAQAAARPLGGVFNTIAVLCAPEEGDDLDPALAARVHARLDRLRMAGREHLVRPPDYVPIDIALLVCPKAGAAPASVREAVKAALAPGSAARPGFFHRSRMGFGAELRLADLLAAASRAPGVGAAKALAFRPLRESGGAAVRRVIALGPTEIAQFAADEGRPERGRLAVRVEGVDAPLPPGAGFVADGPAAGAAP